MHECRSSYRWSINLQVMRSAGGVCHRAEGAIQYHDLSWLFVKDARPFVKDVQRPTLPIPAKKSCAEFIESFTDSTRWRALIDFYLAIEKLAWNYSVGVSCLNHGRSKCAREDCSSPHGGLRNPFRYFLSVFHYVPSDQLCRCSRMAEGITLYFYFITKNEKLWAGSFVSYGIFHGTRKAGNLNDRSLKLKRNFSRTGAGIIYPEVSCYI